MDVLCLGLMLFMLVTFADGASLNDYILDYQPLHFNPLHLHEQHARVRRSADQSLKFTLKAYGRTFNVRLQPSKSIFAEDHELVIDNGPPTKVDTSFIYDGNVEGEPNSSVHMSIINGSISGHIIIPGNTTYHIEPARNHLNHSDFHTIIYPESHMNLDPYRHMRTGTGRCGGGNMYKKLQDMWQPIDETPNRFKRDTFSDPNPYNKYTEHANQPHYRKRRQLADEKKTCFMSLRADVLLYKHFLSKNNNNPDKAKELILSLFANHIKAINDIYTVTPFAKTDNPVPTFRGINFQLQRSVVMTDCTAGVDSGYCTDNLDVSNFLDLTANEKHDAYCLVHTFTYRDFVGGTLGLAWVATPDSRNSGVCGKYGPVRDNNNGISDRSLNTGIVTLINFKQDVPPRVSQLTFAHEVGHNFGAQHDTTSVCAPYGTSLPDSSNGNYIMFPSATQGNLPNNAKFSTCSKDAIARVLETLAPNGKRDNCFKASNNSFCGNRIVEGTEKCDCGFEGECTDQCCNEQKESADSQVACTFKNSSVKCSPSQGPCCQSSCQFVADTAFVCQAATECKDSINCDGTSATCPVTSAKNKANFTFCNEFNRVCISGECMGSVCSKINWIECFLTTAQGATVENMCYVSCKETENSECISSYDTAKVDKYPVFKQLLDEIKSGKKETQIGVKRPPGSPCNDYKGFCDVFSKCRNVDAEGPFKQLTDLIFNPVTLKNIRTWITDHWWAVLLMCIGVVVFMGVFIKIFGYSTPNKNPRRKPQESSELRSRARPPTVAPKPSSSAPRPQDKRDYGAVSCLTPSAPQLFPVENRFTVSQYGREGNAPGSL
ncbi:disintegrin and metalloproteinase domain-containing protein 10-like isoform X2 [Physella acuta]|uniref:disintegrin and metalloproteinase domain-containing protein 10-like isoform X2 n=1 Tax=Physella acuta TaxID=109671 RepID=UPI0027DCCB11|nr:disintegrin and metalloproteinase domain-containing protein 10-like isoform X2 [Physella acuta]